MGYLIWGILCSFFAVILLLSALTLSFSLVTLGFYSVAAILGAIAVGCFVLFKREKRPEIEDPEAAFDLGALTFPGWLLSLSAVGILVAYSIAMHVSGLLEPALRYLEQHHSRRLLRLLFLPGLAATGAYFWAGKRILRRVGYEVFRTKAKPNHEDQEQIEKR